MLTTICRICQPKDNGQFCRFLFFNRLDAKVPHLKMENLIPVILQIRHFWTFMEPRNRFQGMNSASLCSLVGRYDNPIPTRFLAPIDCLKIPALGTRVAILYSVYSQTFFKFRRRLLLMFYLPAQTANSEFNLVFHPLVIILFVEKQRFTTQQNVLLPSVSWSLQGG